MATTTTNLETVGTQAPSTTASLPAVSGLLTDSPPVLHPTQVALLTLSSTTLTAYAIPSTTGLAVLADSGQTLTFRDEGITLSDGNVVSLGFDGLVQSTTTAMYSALTGEDVSFALPFPASPLLTSSYPLPTGPGPVIFNSADVPPALETTLAMTTMENGLTSSQTSAGVTLTTSQSGGSAGGSTDSATQTSASPSASQEDAAASLSAGRAAMLLGAVGGVVAFGL